MSGGVPLYANPQMGVFSLQMLLVLIFGAPIGLKLALIVYTIMGYLSMYLLLRKFFRVEKLISTCLSLLWIFCSFFVSHLPSHFTFAWYMLTPFFLYLALTVKGWKGGLFLGSTFAVMAQSQIHNPFFHISLLVGIVLLFRLIRDSVMRKQLLICLGVAAVIFVVLAGHRVLLTAQNVHDFSRYGQGDPAADHYTEFMGLLAPFSVEHHIQAFNTPQIPEAPFGFGEATATIGIAAHIAVVIAIVYVVYLFRENIHKKIRASKGLTIPLLILGIAALCLALGLGRFSRYAPYSFLKHVPIFGEMRVSTRWFLFVNLFLLLFMGLASMLMTRRSFARFAMQILLVLGVLETFALNVGYQNVTLSHEPVKPAKASYQYPFSQTALFGATRFLPDGSKVQDNTGPHGYREYDATLYNEGVLYANDSLVQLALSHNYHTGHPTCPWEQGCGLIKSNNARIISWSPNAIKLQRTAGGPISLNMNNSKYFLINGRRDTALKVAEPYRDFTINNPAKTITLEIRPTL